MIIFFFECVLDVYQWVEIEVDLKIKECPYQGTADNLIEAACCSWTSGKTYEQTKRKTRPAKADNVVVFTVYANIFVILLTVTWEIFTIKVTLHSHFLMIIYLFFFFCLWKYLNTSPVVEKLDDRINLTYSSYLFSVGYKIRITNWNQLALLDGYAFHHVTVLFLEGENLTLKCSFLLNGTRRIVPW